MLLPKKIDPCPIVDSILEIRFATTFPHDAIFGIVYNIFKDRYKSYESLPILQLPEPVRKSDPNLKFKPYYRISNEKFVIQIGADILAISSFPVYIGWELFQKEISEFVASIIQLSIIENVLRIGLRVINFFPKIDIFQKAKISLIISDKTVASQNTLVTTDFIHKENIKSTLNISNNALINVSTGSIIDVDTFSVYNETFDVPTFMEIINVIHNFEKTLFFSLLKDDFLKKFNPEY